MTSRFISFGIISAKIFQSSSSIPAIENTSFSLCFFIPYSNPGFLKPVNKIGLRNPGFEHGIKNHKKNEVFSIAGIEEDDWKIFAELIPSDTNLEVNMSCPNIESHFTSGIENFSYESRQWYIGKISPLTTFDELEKYINEFNFKQIHACNTLPIEKGGLSGKELIPYTSKFIEHIKQYYPHIEIIAGGGISEKKDIEHYIELGADHISLGTVCFNPVKLGRLL